MKRIAPSTALYGLLAFSAAALVLCFAFVPPVAQWDSYHHFADARPLFGMPNGLDVLSNVGFLFAGAAGLVALLGVPAGACPKPPPAAADEPWERRAFLLLFATVVLVAFGSAYYHLAPSNPRLFWDRLPLAAALGAIFGLVIADRIGPTAGRRAFLPLVLAGAGSTIVWRATGDLRLYGLVQMVPMAALPPLLLLRPGRHDRTDLLLATAGLYGLAKLCEALDHQIFSALGGVVSGHTLKHLFAAAGVAALIPYVRRRRLVSAA